MKRKIKKQIRLLTILQFLEVKSHGIPNNAIIRTHLYDYVTFGLVSRVNYVINERHNYGLSFKHLNIKSFR